MNSKQKPSSTRDEHHLEMTAWKLEMRQPACATAVFAAASV
jgi:hypothetical protein